MMQGEYYTKSRRRDMDSLIRGHHFRLGSGNASFETTARADYKGQRGGNAVCSRSQQSSSIYLGADQPEKTTCSRSAYSKPASFPCASGVQIKQENVKHHFTLGLHPAPCPSPSLPLPTLPVQIHHPTAKTAVVFGTDSVSVVSTAKESYKRITTSQMQESQKDRCGKAYWKPGTALSDYETTASAIGKSKGEKREMCRDARRTYIRIGEGRNEDKRSLSQEHYGQYEVLPVENTAERSAFVLSSHFSLGSHSPSPEFTQTSSPPRPSVESPLLHLKKTSVEFGTSRIPEKQSVYSSQFQQISKGDRAAVSPWTGCSVTFGEKTMPLASDYHANFRRHSLVDNCLTHSLDLHRHNFQLGPGVVRSSADYQTTAGEIGRSTGTSFTDGGDFGSFSKQKHFPFGLRGNGGFETTTGVDFTYKSGQDRARAVQTAAYKSNPKGDYRTVHQTAYRWVQPVPSAQD